MKPKIILATGVFDILHPGHIHYLSESKELGDKLIVIVANDKTILKNKGRLPIFNHFERKILIESLKFVDEAVIGSENDFIKTAADLKPDLITFGWDQKVDEEMLKEKFMGFGLKIKVMQINRFEKYSSGQIREKINNKS